MASVVADKGTAVIVLLGGWVGVIACRICSWYKEQLTAPAVFGIGVVCLVAIVVPLFILRDRQKPLEPLYFVLMICTFSSCVDILIALEGDGRIKGWTDFYLTDGEPYLGTAHGVFICYWDFFGHYTMYAALLYYMCREERVCLRNVALYWFGSIFHSLIVFLPGNVLGTFSVKPSYLLNVPYILLPLYVLYRVTSEERARRFLSQSERSSVCRSILLRPVDLLLAVASFACVVIAFVRGLAALDCRLPFFRHYRDAVEPYMQHPDFYPKLQMLTYLFYFTIAYCLSIFALIKPGCQWMLDLALIHAGAAAQAQVSHIGASLHWKTQKFRPSADSLQTFWVVNLLLVLLPHLLAARVLVSPRFFLCSRSSDKAKAGE